MRNHICLLVTEDFVMDEVKLEVTIKVLDVNENHKIMLLINLVLDFKI